MADPGWYPQQDGTQRYWDGSAWTEHVEEITVIPMYVAPASGHERSVWFKTRTAIGAGGLLLGLGLGAASAGGDSVDTDALSKNIAALKATNEELEDDVADLSSQEPGVGQEQVDKQIAAAVKAAKVEAEAKRKKAVAEERRKADARVAAAEKAAADDESLGLTGGAGSNSGGTDPRFDTCGDAIDAGYGNYREGVDPEYDWYQDRDNDGVVCE